MKKYQEEVKRVQESIPQKCHEYFLEHQKVDLTQTMKLINFVKKHLEKETNFEDPANQAIAMEAFNNILVKNEQDDFDEHVAVEQTIENQQLDEYGQFRGDPHYNHHNQQEFYNPYNPHEYQTSGPNFRVDLQKFLTQVDEKRRNMKIARENVIKKVHKVVEEIPQIRNIKIYGSYETQLDLPWRDIDFVTFSDYLTGHECLGELNARFVEEKEHHSWIEKIDYISSASVPIIKIVTKDSGFEVKVDITFGDQTHKGSDCVALGKF